MTITRLSPSDAFAKVNQGATLIDIRPDDEFARTHITGAVCQPIDRLAGQGVGCQGEVIFYCLTGFRTNQNLDRLCDCLPSQPIYVLEGGLKAWQQAGLPTITDRTQPISLMRQVQIVAGALVLLGVALGTWWSPWFYALSAFVGAGLVFAGLTGFCGMARLLALLPYNRTST